VAITRGQVPVQIPLKSCGILLGLLLIATLVHVLRVVSTLLALTVGSTLLHVLGIIMGIIAALALPTLLHVRLVIGTTLRRQHGW
jgi:hypothetical protein